MAPVELWLRVLVVGAGFAGTLHAEAWKKVGAEVEFYDPRLGLDSFPTKLERADIVDFCDTPVSRAYYTLEFIDVLAEKDAVFYEKPPFPVAGAGPSAWAAITKRINAVPVHNYVYMEQVRRAVMERPERLEVVILRDGPHKRWYPTMLTGGGILADHGYHWLYVAATMLKADVRRLKCSIQPPTGPDYVAGCRTEDGRLSMYLSWLSPVVDTIVNGARLEPPPFTSGSQVTSLAELFRDTVAWELHRDVSVDVMQALGAAYMARRMLPPGREPPEPHELERLLPVPVETVYDRLSDYVVREVVLRSGGR